MTLESSKDAIPLISIVIPTLNEVESIGLALKHIANNLDFIHCTEILIIDGGSNDGTVEVASSFMDRLELYIIDAPRTSVYKALNIGLQMARGKYFVRVDARSAIPPNYLEEVLNGLQIPEVECVGGIQSQYGNSIISHSIACVTTSLIGTGGAKFRMATKSGFVDSVYLGAYRTTTLKSMGGYEDGAEYVSEDSFINKCIREAGKKIYLNSELRILYPAKSSFRKLVKQYVIYGAAKGYLIRKHKKFTSPRQIIPIIFLVGIILMIFGCFVGWIPWWIFEIFLVFYVLLLLLGNLFPRERQKNSSGKLWARCIATACIHFSWPAGFFLFLFNPRLHKRFVNWL